MKHLGEADITEFVVRGRKLYSIILQLEKGEKGTNLLAEHSVTQQISDIRKHKEMNDSEVYRQLRDQQRSEA